MALTIGIGQLSTLGVDPAGGSSFTTLGGIIDAIENECSASEVDTTLLGDTWMTSLPADLDPGELTFEIALDNGDDDNQTLVDLFSGRTIATWKITYSNSESPDTFSGYIKTLGRSIAKRSMLTRKVTVKLTGDAGLVGAGS